MRDADLPPLVDPGDVPTPTGGSPVSAFDVEVASAQVREDCGWHIAPEVQSVRVLDSTRDHSLLLPTLRLTSVDALNVLGVDVDVTALELAGIEWSQNGVLSRYGWWPERRRAVAVTFTHGFDEVPRALAGVVIALATRRARDATGGVATTVQAGQTTITTRPTGATADPGGYTDLERSILARYALPPSV